MTSSTNSGGYQNIQVLPFLDDKHIFIKLGWFWHSSKWRTIATININQTHFVKNKVMKFHQNRS